MASLKFVVELLYSSCYTIFFLSITIYAWLEWVSYHRLRQFKDPVLPHFSNIWMTNSISTKAAHLKLYNISEKYGMVYGKWVLSDRYSFLLATLPELAQILLTCDPEVVIRINSARSRYTKPKWYTGQKVEVDHNKNFSALDETLLTKKGAQMAMGWHRISSSQLYVHLYD